MTNPTRKEIIDAHKALGELCRLAENPPLFVFKDPHKIDELRQTMLKALPAHPTMAEIEWDDDKHYLAEAEQIFYGTVIMLGLNENGSVVFITPNSREVNYSTAYPDSVTPTGKRYTLTEALRTHRSAEKNPD